MSFLYIGMVAGQDTSSAEQGERQDIAPHIQMLLCCALVLVVKPFGLPSPELKTCGQWAGCVSIGAQLPPLLQKQFCSAINVCAIKQMRCERWPDRKYKSDLCCLYSPCETAVAWWFFCLSRTYSEYWSLVFFFFLSCLTWLFTSLIEASVVVIKSKSI